MKPLTNKELVILFSQLAMILKAGISSLEGISIMREDAPEGEGKQILEGLCSKLEETGCLYRSMEETGVFPEYACRMTEIGEESGRLEEVMEGLTDHYEREENLAQGIKNALTYPVLMLGLMTVVVLVLMIKVMPVFHSVFEQLGGGLTGISLGIMNLGMAMSSGSGVLMGILTVVLLLSAFLLFTGKGRAWLKSRMEQSGKEGGIGEKMACARVADGMNLCIKSGLDLNQGLELTHRLTTHRRVKDRLEFCRQQMEKGEAFDKAMTESGLFPGLYGRMIAVGIRTGAVDQVMDKIAKQYEEEVLDRLQSLVSMIEPTLVAVLSSMAGLILLSVMLPLMGIMSSMG